ncbi:MAG: hypothetical protein JSV33_10615 [bacterium]|nr:MAG: hypothetical protein JSV33_10615 [bacterium]
MMATIFKGSFIVIVFLTIVSAGCTPPAKPLYLCPSFHEEWIDEIVVLPVVDLRFGEAKDLDLDSLVQTVVEDALCAKNYAVKVCTDRSLITHVSESIFLREDVNALKRIGPTGCRWVILIALHASSTREIGDSEGSADMTALFIDKRRGRTVWRDKAVSRHKRGGVLGVLSKGSVEELAVSGAAETVMKSFPKR